MDHSTFFEKFDQFADALDAVAKMRELVLELAVRGKLVAQVTDDEQAENIVGRDEELSAEAPFEIPEQWTWTRLSLLADINGGFAFKSTAYTEEGTRVVRISDFDEFGFKDHKVVRHPFTPDLQKFMLDEGNILMAMTGGTVGKSYFVRSLPEPMVVNQRVATIKVSGNANPSYVDIAIRSEMTQEVIRKAKNSTNDNISMGDIKGFAIPVPPLAEQKRIVAKVDELMALCDRLEAQQQERETRHAALARATLARFADAPTPANLHFLFHPSYAIPPADLRKSILTLAFQGDLTKCDPGNLTAIGAEEVLNDAEAARRSYWNNRHGAKRKYPDPEPFESEDLPRIREHWLWASIDAVCAQVTDGEHIQPPYQAEGVPMLSAKHVRDGHVTLEGAGLISEEAFQKSIERCKPENGDILIVSVGATTGRSAIVANCPRFAIVRSVLLLKPVIMKEYLLWWLKNPWAFTWMTQASGASAQPHLYIRDLKHLAVPIPPLAEQLRIVAKVEQLMALVDALETQLATSRATAANLLSALVAELTAAC